jgi:ParB family chromosome partitioning protein
VSEVLVSLPALADAIRMEVYAAEEDWRAAVAHAVRAGELLIEAKATVAHGEWLLWLEANFSMTRQTAANYMRLAANGKRVLHLPTVHEALALVAERELGREDGREYRDSHVVNSTGSIEWYTPHLLVDAARAVMGGIDLDPASTPEANDVVGARRFYTLADDGLAQPWAGRVWLNPPYRHPAAGLFTARLVDRHRAGDVPEAIALTNNGTETDWLQAFLGAAAAACFLDGRIHFWRPDGHDGRPLQGQVMTYFGDRPERFGRELDGLGVVFYR